MTIVKRSGRITLPAENPAGYCRHHRKGLTYAQIRAYGCCNKRKQWEGRRECRHLDRNEDHPAWRSPHRKVTPKGKRRWRR